jgi:ribonucleoside-diphosphate reductase alpha chain
MDEIPDDVKKAFVTSHDIAPEWHIRIQSAFQKYVDNAVSKTVNFPHSATEEDIEKVYTLAYELGCKGVTVYRDGSRDSQVLEKKSSVGKPADVAANGEESSEIRITPRARGEVTMGATRKMTTGCGSLYVTINEDEHGLFEVFATMGKSGGCAASQTEAVSRLISLGLRSGIDKNQLIRQIKGVRCPNQAWEKGGKIYSCSDAIAKALERHVGVNPELLEEEENSGSTKNMADTNGRDNEVVMVGVCPDCHGPLEYESGCSVCRSCGFSRCG